MKYILMMNTMRSGQSVLDWPKKDLQAMIAFMKNFDVELRQSGELVSAEGLAFPDQARLVRAGANGEPITDGVFLAALLSPCPRLRFAETRGGNLLL